MNTENGNKTNLNPELKKQNLKEQTDCSTRISLLKNDNDLSYKAHEFE